MSTPCHLQNLRPMLNEHDCSVTVTTLPPGLNLIHSYCQHSLLFRFCISHGLNQTECKEKYRQYGIPQTFRWQGCGPCKVSVCSALSEATEVQYPQNKDSTKSNSVLTLWAELVPQAVQVCTFHLLPIWTYDFKTRYGAVYAKMVLNTSSVTPATTLPSQLWLTSNLWSRQSLLLVYPVSQDEEANP